MPQNDLISRSALREKFQDECCGECGCCEHNLDAEYVNGIWEYRCALIEDAPSVERPKGQWNIVEFNSNSRTVVIECPECSAVFEVESFSFGLNYNFCHNCGAYLGGEDDA